MINYIKNILGYIGISSLFVLFAYFLKSTFLEKFLDNDLLVILTTVLAINIATSSILISKINEIEERVNFTFVNAVRGIKTALKEQIILIIISVVLLIANKSPLLRAGDSVNDYLILILHILLFSIFIWYLDILRDIATAMFDIKKKIDEHLRGHND